MQTLILDVGEFPLILGQGFSKLSVFLFLVVEALARFSYQDAVLNQGHRVYEETQGVFVLIHTRALVYIYIYVCV